MWLEIAQTGASLLGGIIGQEQAAKAQREANKELDKMQAQENTRYYNNMGDSLHRADVAELSKQVYDNVRSTNQQALNPMNNNTTEGANAVREKNSQMTQQMASTVNADNTKLRMDNENRHTQAMNAVAQGRANAATNKAAQIANATSSMINGVSGVASALDKPSTLSTASAKSNKTTSTSSAPAAEKATEAVKTSNVVAPEKPIFVDTGDNVVAGAASPKKYNLFDGIFG